MQLNLSPFIYINGQATEMLETNLDAFIRARYQKPEHVVAELNGTVIARSNWKTTALKTQDRLELLSFVGGG
jgi:sulfur carrier protein